MDIETAYARVRQAFSAGRAAHGYLIVGALRGAAGELARRILKDLFGEHVDDRAHPDIHWLAPEKKSRIVSVEAMREKMIEPMAKTPFAGGWKAGVLLGADRLRKESANAFLKTLEEPPPRTVFLLLTENPEQLLPTIVSRCQRIDLDDALRKGLVDPWLSQTLAVLAAKDMATAAARAAAGRRLFAVLASLRERAQESVAEEYAGADEGPGAELTDAEMEALVSSRYREMRGDFLETLMGWFRDLMVLCCAGAEAPLVHEKFRTLLLARASRLTRAETFRNVEAVEELAATLERNVPEEPALSFFADRARFGVETPA